MVRLQQLIDDDKCYETVRRMRWPDGVQCPHCQFRDLKKRGRDDSQPARQRYHCRECRRDFDDLTGTIFSGHHQPLRVWMLCLYLMGLNLSNEQIAQELDLSASDLHQMTEQLRSGIVARKEEPQLQRRGRVRRVVRGRGP
jgi:transposase